MIGCDRCGVPIPAKVCPVCGYQHGPHYDGGPLDLGIIRAEPDTLATRNNFELFYETWIGIQLGERPSKGSSHMT